MVGSGATSSANRKPKRSMVGRYRKIAQGCYQLALVVKEQRDRRALLDGVGRE